ncbi:MAG: Ig-like domain-containing protein [Dysgonamonadaceae bacterium]|jgi:hypothetical protein|nr:Ig-like domain-containing protein [Dysgonamonadaceae bacterium]
MRFFYQIEKVLFATVYFLLLVCGFYACASMGAPAGGDYDIEPPRFIKSNPEPNTIRFNRNKITLFFNEYISIEKPSEKVIITPPQKKAPVIKSIGKQITVELRDSLIPNTTYTFDFTNGIVDNNEKNTIEGYTFAFSTGEVVDSLVVSGLLLNAENLEPMPNVMVGIHSDLSDTAFTSLPFLRTSQTNELGRFWIRNIASGSYHIFALNDANRDFRFDQPGEAIAFDDSLIIPSFEPAVRMDTIWKDSLTIDSVNEIHYNRFTPDNIILRLFKEDFNLQYLLKTDRIDSSQFTVNFNSKVDALPAVYLIDDEENETEWYVLEQSSDKKTLTYWITDSLIYQKDTINIKIDYMAHDTLKALESKTDTIKLIQKKKEVSKKKKGEENKMEILNINITPTGTMDIYDTIKFTFSEPLLYFEPHLIHIQQKIDTLWEKRDFPILQDSLNPRVYYIDHKWPYGQEYRIDIDSSAIFSVYGKWNDSIKVNLKTKPEDAYVHLYIGVEGTDGPGFGQLLDGSEKIIKESLLQEGELVFENLKPGKYFLRYIDDKNGNGKWDIGNYAEKRQPEPVYYYPAVFELKEFMGEWEQTWNVTELPIEKQKPLEIVKNKPKEKQSKRKEDENKRNSNTRNSSGIQGMSRF